MNNKLDSDTDFYVLAIISPHAIFMAIFSFLILITPQIDFNNLDYVDGNVSKIFNVTKGTSLIIVSKSGAFDVFSTCRDPGFSVGDYVYVASRQSYRSPIFFIRYAAYVRHGEKYFCENSIFKKESGVIGKGMFFVFFIFGFSCFSLFIFLFFKRRG